MSYSGTLQTQSNRSDWQASIRIASAIDGSLIDLSGLTIKLQVRAQPYPINGHGYSSAYGYDYGRESTSLGYPVLTGSTDDGVVTTPAPGVLSWRFPATSMSALGPGLYNVGILLSDDSGNTQQLFIGTVPIVEGGVI